MNNQSEATPRPAAFTAAAEAALLRRVEVAARDAWPFIMGQTDKSDALWDALDKLKEYRALSRAQPAPAQDSRAPRGDGEAPALTPTPPDATAEPTALQRAAACGTVTGWAGGVELRKASTGEIAAAIAEAEAAARAAAERECERLRGYTDSCHIRIGQLEGQVLALEKSTPAPSPTREGADLRGLRSFKSSDHPGLWCIWTEHHVLGYGASEKDAALICAALAAPPVAAADEAHRRAYNELATAFAADHSLSPEAWADRIMESLDKYLASPRGAAEEKT